MLGGEREEGGEKGALNGYGGERESEIIASTGYVWKSNLNG